MMRRRSLLAAAIAALIVPITAPARSGPRVVVYKTPTCGCCTLWVDHLRANGFEVQVHDVQTTNGYRRTAGVPTELGSCHTALVGEYAIEGHVPAREIHRILKERPKIKGLAVPGMPIGSPGMEMNGRVDRYDVIAFDGSAKTRVFASYPARAGGRE